MADHGSTENGLNWSVEHIEYKELHTAITEAAARFAHFYANAVSQYSFLAGHTGRPMHNLDHIDFPQTPLSITTTGVHCHVKGFPDLLPQPKPAFSLKLVIDLSAEDGFIPMSYCQETSFCRICCSPFKNRLSTPTAPISLLPAAAMANSRQTSAKRRRPQEQQQQRLPGDSSEICAYWPASPPFDPQRFLLKRLLFINSDRTKYDPVGFYPAHVYQSLVEFGAIWRAGRNPFF